jgi:N-acetylmuramoyl-L-alanine amidase
MHPIRTVLMLSACLLLAACASAPQKARNPLATWVPSPNQNARTPVIIVIHHTEQKSVQQSLHTLRTANSGGPVSAHYLIGADGHRYQLVADERRAWHAGAGRWGTITDLNSASIGIELDNDGRSPFSAAQIESLIVLLRDLTTRLNIPPRQVIGHADLAPTRKQDPSRFFPWQQLAEAGFGVAARGRRCCAGRLRRVECAGPLWLSAGQPRGHRRRLPPPFPWPRRPAEDAGCRRRPHPVLAAAADAVTPRMNA